MAAERLYLRGDVVAEPLFNQWYAWSSLISPASSAMFVANSHLKIMQSFVAAPGLHVAALRNPAMRGGPFIAYDAGRAKDVKALMEKTVAERPHALELAAAIQRTDEMLASEADGSSLEPLYEKVPDVLKGYVELVYDLNNHPSVRFIEGLLYESPYYSLSSQSISLSRGHIDERPFMLSTPQLADDRHLNLPMPFNSPELDAFFKMKAEPRTLADARALLGVKDGDENLFSSFFTPQAPRRAERYAGDGVRVRYFGHACLLVESRDVSVMLDPLVSYETDGGLARYTYADLPDSIDYVLITHNHQDHCMFETLLQLRHKIKTVVVPKSGGGGLADPSLKLILRRIGFERVVELDEMESIEIEGGRLVGLPFLGEHADLNIRTKLAYLINLRGRSILCAADSNNIEPRIYEHLHRLIGDVDIFFIGMECDGGPLSWLYGALMTKPVSRKQDQSRRLNGSDCRKGIGIVERLRPRQVYVYAMGQEPWLTFLTSIQYTPESRPIVESDSLVRECRQRGITSERLFGHKEIII
ncbi:MAG TPA: MBL fold metallo-hydrolase [Pyrinomonadaceae bacterium]|jgi:L-ascorbate metabolism protein UlaG (beta-lactamase superfamily)|nr:MBL fold metallo-hydrolase [Pyrinomonadaceae bacterium]